MIDWFAAALLVAGFAAIFKKLGLVDKSNQVVSAGRRALGILGSADMDDRAKETAMQREAVLLFKLFLILTLGGAAALGLPLGLLYLGDMLGFLKLDAALATAMSPAFLVASSALAIAALCLGAGKSQASTAYSGLDRLLHRIAFRTGKAQIALADMEDHLFAKQLGACISERPVFITALPRAGTTLLLQCLVGAQDFASHCYRDMPFVLTPCLWSMFSARFQKESQLRERAHGDGMLVNADSAEALEEVLWLNFWDQQYRRDRIIPWERQEHDEFKEFFRSHMQKIILLRGGGKTPGLRYLSKNNGNIARTRLLPQLFPDAVIIIPFRDPLRQAASLLEQHLNFSRIHEQDPFAAEYMLKIGHYDFGRNLRPIDFDGWLDKRASQDARQLPFWLEYWVAAYGHLLRESRDIVHFLDYQRLCGNPVQSLQAVANIIGMSDPATLVARAADIHPERHREPDPGALPAALLHAAAEVYAGLKESALA